MIIDIPKLRPEGEWFEGQESQEILSIHESGFRPCGPVRYRLFAQAVSGQLIVRGSVRAFFELQCVRCTEFYSTTIEEMSFLRTYQLSDASEAVDVTPDLREDILLRLPHHPVCSSACKGLCPYCGANLNLGPCSCKPPGDHRWSALDNVKLG
ncbi:MAG: DUF177 domain-containing protein [Kiritimatiellae bacterium]|nr:DUF177 domain-containing protein [Kiritimatiellia bacterium]MDW8458311.1 DUF177 domain-containing protein [Verrucomicrobiota bacterium]